MAPEEGLAPCLQELSSLEVEPLEVLVYPSESQQDSGLDTLTTAPDEFEIAILSTDKRALPVNGDCCCCCPVCCCFCACGCCC
jgi:hypothetical protein